ncbi:MAG TPA: TIGR01212 family radical SAM protein [Candidatus Eremiobacteraeota bacterium]|nr:MAG: coproporphyrinogen III oxidase [bacterium ADurb.Bin363]HPZ07607.1 TIGR01212 family radical SAM protein [Candidatus Eremiobacteraeota bacterium]
MELKRYRTLNSYFKEKFGCRVHKVALDAGFTCPNRDGTKGIGGCIYCNFAGSGTGAYKKSISITEQMKEGMNYLGKRFKAEKFIAYFQSFSNTYGRDLKEKYDESLVDKRVVGLSIGTRPDCINDDIIDLLVNYQNKGYMVWLEMGLQSIHKRTLEFINRHHSCEDFLFALRKTKEKGIPVCVHIIFGLPGESFEEMIETATFLAHLSIDGIKFHNLYVIKETPLENLWKEGKYRPLEQEEYVNIICEALIRLPEDTVIQRLTGDPAKNELVAPHWSLDKKGTLQLIEELLLKKNLWQGKFYFKP